MSYAFRTNLALGGAIVSALLAQAFPQFMGAWVILGGLSSVVAIHALFSRPEPASSSINSAESVVDEVVEARSAEVQDSRKAPQSGDDVYHHELLTLEVHRELMAQTAFLRQARDCDAYPIWSRALNSSRGALAALNSEVRLRDAESSELSRAAVALNLVVLSSGMAVSKRHGRSSMLDEQLVNWMRHIDEPDQVPEQKHTLGAKKRIDGRSVTVPDFCGSALLH